MRTFFMLIVFFACIPLQAQDSLLTLEQAILGSYNDLKVDNLKQLQWIAGSKQLSYLDSLDERYGLVKITLEDTRPEMLLSLDTLKKALRKSDFETPSRFPSVEWLDPHRFRFSHNSRYFSYHCTSKQVTLLNKIPEEAKHPQIEDTRQRVAFTRGQNVYIAYNPETVVQVTHDTEEGIVNGDPYVHRAEFGIRKGKFWSPGGNYLAFYRKDERNVSRYPLVDLDERPATLREIRYPMAGMASEHVQIGVYNLNSASLTFLQTGQPKDHYLTGVTWSPDEQYIYVGVLNRDQDHLRLVQFDARSGQPLRTLFEEKDEQWVEPEHGLFFVPEHPNRFLWLSKRNGYNHLYHYRDDGKLLDHYDIGERDITDIIGFSSDGRFVFFEAASPDGMERHGYRLDVQSGDIEKRTEASGIHNLKPGSDGRYVIDVFHNHTTPRTIAIHDRNGQRLRTLLEAENPLRNFKLGAIRYLKIETENGTRLNARMILPVDFDPTKRYPVIIYVYGGPHGQMVSDSWLRGWPLWFQYMAQRGYIVFSLDNRGTNNRGLEFEQAIHRRLGTVELEDQMAGVKFLKSRNFVDTTRIGVHGWSYGGFMTITMLTRRPGVFKAGVAGGPVIDWRYYEVMYGERYMETPQSNPEGYEEANLLNYVDQLQNPLLIIHGAVDPVVVWQNSLLYLRKAIDMGKQVDYFVYPGDEHNMRGKDRVHLYRKITDYFERHLK